MTESGESVPEAEVPEYLADAACITDFLTAAWGQGNLVAQSLLHQLALRVSAGTAPA